jgi:hypothetical protein
MKKIEDFQYLILINIFSERKITLTFCEAKYITLPKAIYHCLKGNITRNAVSDITATKGSHGAAHQ